MGTNKPYVKAWIKPDELKLTDELCRRKGYRRSTFIREIIKFCAFNNLSPMKFGTCLKIIITCAGR